MVAEMDDRAMSNNLLVRAAAHFYFSQPNGATLLPGIRKRISQKEGKSDKIVIFLNLKDSSARRHAPQSDV